MRLTLRQRQVVWAYIFLSVSLVFFVVIRWYPTILAFNISFRDWNVFEAGGPWVGLQNYQEIWADFFKPRSAVRAAFWNTVRYVVLGVPTQMALGLGIAMLLGQIRRFVGFFRAAYFIPYVTSFVAVAFVWNWLYAPQSGLINQILQAFGLPPQPFTKSPNQALPAITAVAVWRSLGFTVIIFLAGLQQIPDIYYEAARIDGANRWQIFWRVTLPLLNPVIVYLSVLQTISFLRMFDLVQNMSEQGQGGPLKSTTTVVLEVYREGFSSYNMGYAAALTVILFFVILLITIFQLRVLSRRVEY
ncbi:sugar ABC transporter permease [Litorilinea aerophila]|uniref:Sugar ABC transporter permease n=1 Tax=Litorilinea aerophila TaxID=1204385 RepID=A0A540VJI1_9CHLR|nr:sugar ABC transporter permease [Litorilinea aerophila]MCC9075384.1 sugar ABC transporter permease [Litorilinea aerophila]GIV78611.1 MAG: sugar ABC transporter permease [Litorilinea sp.]